MSDLQLLLIALGILIIAGVVFYNWLQENKLRKNIAEEFIVPQKDVLVEEFYIDADELVDRELSGVTQKSKILDKLNDPTQTPQQSPTASKKPETLAAALEMPEIESDDDPVQPELEPATQDDARHEPFIVSARTPDVAEDTIAEPASEAAPEILDKVSPLPNEIHPQIDLTAFLYAAKPIDLQTLHLKANAIIHDMGVPIMMHALDEVGTWHFTHQLPPDALFKQFACSIQLADRSGPVTKTVLNKFQFSVEHIGLELNAHVEWQGTGDAVQRAIDLDQFCIEVDQVVSVHLINDAAPAHGTKFKGLAEANGLKLTEQGRFCYYANGMAEQPQFVLIDQNQQLFTAENLRNNVVKGAVFQIEIPKVTHCEQVFNLMINVAEKMANAMNAKLVDDNQKPLGDLQVEKIRQQLKVIHARMVARGVMPGSASSMRLFN